MERLLYQMARKYYFHHGKEACARHGVTLEDLQQECYFAFLDAVKVYKPEKGYKFTSYLSRHAENRFRACMGIFTKLDALNYADSLNVPIGEEQETESGDMIPDEKAEAELTAVDDEAENEYFREYLEAALTGLTPIQAAVIRCRYSQRQTRPQTAEALHTTPEAVRREEAAALKNLRKSGHIQRIGVYLEMAAYHRTGWSAWYYEQGSVEERTIESMEKKGYS